MADFQHPYSRGLRKGTDRTISQNDERARTSRELSSKPAWKPTQKLYGRSFYRAKNWDLIIADPSTRTVSIQLPKASSNTKLEIYVKHVGSSGTITVYPTTGETIDGNSTYSWSIPYAGYHFVAIPNYGEWVVI